MKNKTFFAFVVIFACALLLASSGAYAQNRVTGTTATVVGYWKKGDTKRLSVRMSKDKDVNGKLTKEGASYDVTLRVLDETEDSYTVEWTYENMAAQGGNPLMSRLYEMSNGLRVLYRTDEMGSFTELLNWKEVQAHLFKGLEMLEKQPGIEKDVMKAVVAQVKGIYSSKESIESTLKDINIYHSPYGAEYTLNEKITADTHLPNILGGEPVPARIEITMTELDQQRDHCKIVTGQMMDREKTSALVYEFLKKTAEQSGRPLPADFEVPVMDISDASEHELELAQGWVKRAYFKREVQSGPARQSETYEIILQK